MRCYDKLRHLHRLAICSRADVSETPTPPDGSIFANNTLDFSLSLFNVRLVLLAFQYGESHPTCVLKSGWIC